MSVVRFILLFGVTCFLQWTLKLFMTWTASAILCVRREINALRRPFPMKHDKTHTAQINADVEDSNWSQNVELTTICPACTTILEKAIFDVPNGPFLNEASLPTDHLNAGVGIGCYICKTLDAKELTGWNVKCCPREDFVAISLWYLAEGGHASFSLQPVPEQQFRLLKMGRDASFCSYTGDPKVLDLAKYWLRDCLEYHSCCRKNTIPDSYPTRLLDVLDTVRLIDTAIESPTGPYATVSHCWGNEEFLTLTSDTEVMGRLGISSSNLPPSFRDIISVTRQLGIRWLWIDCYCIFQGDDDAAIQDWAVEADLMSTVYSNAIINFGISHASNPLEGAFVERSCKNARPKIVQLRPTLFHSKQLYYLATKSESDMSDLYHCPLFQRAWCVQERLLCQRMLHFGRSQLYWECHGNRGACESFPAGLGAMTTFLDSAETFGLPKLLEIVSSRRRFKGLRHHIVFTVWNLIVETYTKGKLSFPSKDKMKAIQGVANEAQQLLDDEYKWGCLESSLPGLLYWKPQYGAAHIGRAPSWSWASFDGGHEFQFSTYCMDFVYKPLLWCTFDCSNALTEKMNSRRGFELVCLGKIFYLVSKASETSEYSAAIASTSPQENGAKTFRVGCRFDTPELRSIHPSELRVLPIFEAALTSITLQALILQHLPSGRFRRVGMCWSNSNGLRYSSRLVCWREVYRNTRPQLIVLV